MSRRRSASLALAVAGLAALPLLATAPTTSAAPAPADAVAPCPPGQVLTTKTASQRRQERLSADPALQDLLAAVDAESAAFATACRPVRAPEPLYEISGSETQKALAASGPQGFSPPGALRAAIGARSATADPSEVAGAQGTFTPLGTTPLIGDVEGYDSVNGQGLADIAGRVDSLAYDAAGDRLFSAPGTGGVWASTDKGESWRSIGDALPYQSVGAVDWTSAGGGTVLALSGEASAGGGVYTGLGAFWSDDLGATWNQATGIPDGLMGFEVDVDPTNPSVAYAATSQGLYRSADAGRSWTNVDLPTSPECAGVTGYDNTCFLANWVTDVEVQTPGGTTDAAGGQVIAAVGYRAGNKALFDGTPSSPGNGLYRSETGAVGSFTYLDDLFAVDDLSPDGFAVQERIGRTELGSASGPDQDHGFLYAIVQDAKTFNGGLTTIDIADPTTQSGPIPNNTILNGVYVSSDFGSSWTRMAEEVELQSPLTESALIGTSQAMLYAPGVQAFYNMWIEPDPVGATAAGVPTRLVFGLEEVWESRLPGTPQDGLTQQVEPVSFRVVGPYFADDTCLFLSLGLPTCPTSQTNAGGTTTHPDQQSGIFLPGEGGSVLVVGNDGGTYRQQLTDGEVVDKEAWGRGANAGYNTLLPYSAEVAKDGVVWMGLQDNGSAFIDGEGKQISTFGGDGTFVAVDPDDSKTAYISTPNNAMQVTTDGGLTFSDVAPPVTGAAFVAPFVMDPLDSAHLLTGGPEIVETFDGPTATWTEVFNVGEGATVSATELQGENGYVGFCTTCDIINADPEAGGVFMNGFATNVGGEWRTTDADGLPNRFITSIAADPKDPRTVYVTLGGYSGREWWPEGAFNDANPEIGTGHVFKSTDGGDSFTDISGSLPDVPATWVELNRSQLVIGSQIGAFLSSDTAGTKWAALEGLPAAPVSTIRTQPGNDSRLIVASYGRGVFSYTLSGRAAAPPVVTPPGTGGTPPAAGPGGGGLATTGLPVGVGVLGLLALTSGVVLHRRRQHG